MQTREKAHSTLQSQAAREKRKKNRKNTSHWKKEDEKCEQAPYFSKKYFPIINIFDEM
jgi:hypothetical protein